MRLGKYELLETLGRGGYGTVYRAREVVLDVPRAVKVLHPALAADPDFIERFRREARIAARLEHPHIVPVYELDEAEGRIFLAMKYLPGGSLKDLLAKDGRLPFERALQVTQQTAQALDFAYSQPEQLVHRDVKPGNILFDADGAARLADFGFAKALSSASSASLSASGGMIGTPAYMAPEVWRNKPASPATDVYSLACVVFEMLTGQALFAGDSPPEIMTRHMLDGPQFPARWPDGVPAGAEAVLRQALAQSPEARYPRAGAFAGALAELSAETAQAQQNIEAAEQHRAEEMTAQEKIRREAQEQQKQETPQPAPAQTDQPEKAINHEVLPTTAHSKKSHKTLKIMGIGIGGIALCALFVLAVLRVATGAWFLWGWPTPHLTNVPEPVPDSFGVPMALIPAGSFQMGSTTGYSDEAPVHTVNLSAFYMDIYEVTNAQYAECVADGECSAPSISESYTRDSYYGNPTYADYPVIYVNWNKASDYCAWRDAKLPTEAEWEYAARGGLAGMKYSWGGTFDGSLANYCDSNCPFDNKDTSYNDGYTDTAPVGSYAPNGYGLYDMAGNVWEWVSDRYGTYPSGTVTDPSGPSSGDYRVLRGGSWYFSDYYLRVADRNYSIPTNQYSFIGFRCAAPPGK